MQRILAFLRSNILTLLCIALLTGASGAAWYLLATPIDRSIQAEYAVFEGNPAYNDIIGFHAGAMDWQPYDYPAPP
ncbi:hypothetical protein HMPREF1992_01461, partial [Selenomonas sp. oral taxon 892 str. F0426]